MKNMQVFKAIVISPANYLELKKCGFAGDSFNDVITQLLQDRKNKVAVGSGLEAGPTSHQHHKSRVEDL